MTDSARIIILNGAPRSGKSSIAQAILDTFPGDWVNVGVDYWMREHTPSEFHPGIGLRPGGERPDLEPFVRQSYSEFHCFIAEKVGSGTNVVVDVGYHTWYAEPFDPYQDAMSAFDGFTVLFVGVRCPIETIMERRNASTDNYAKASPGDPVPEPVQRWQTAVHDGRMYDLEVNTSVKSPAECAQEILK